MRRDPFVQFILDANHGVNEVWGGDGAIQRRCQSAGVFRCDLLTGVDPVLVLPRSILLLVPSRRFGYASGLPSLVARDRDGEVPAGAREPHVRTRGVGEVVPQTSDNVSPISGRSRAPAAFARQNYIRGSGPPHEQVISPARGQA